MKIIEIKLTKTFLNRLNDNRLKEKYEKIGWIKIRIMNVKLKNETIETLATNLTNEEFNSDELKLLYGKRWTIETGFDKTEKFGSNRRVFRNTTSPISGSERTLQADFAMINNLFH